MELESKNIKNVLKEFVLGSYDFFRRKYLRQSALNNIRDFENFPEVMLQNARALFVLSTGRCGTDFLNHILKGYSSLDVHHEGDAKYAIASRYLYEHRHKINQRGGELAFLAGRHHALQDAYLFNKIYVETNNRLTFFAPFIENLMPRARFIHLVRHPGNFVRSGMRRGYYTAHSISDYTKIRPVDTDEVHEKWASYSRIEKISWLWYQTNKFIEEFKAKHPEKVLLIRSEYLFESPKHAVSLISNFMHFDTKKVIKVDVEPKNVQKSGEFPRYKNWSRENKDKMRAIVEELAVKYDYQL